MLVSESKLISFLCISSSCGSLSADLLGPLIVGPSISVDDWVPERPPKKPHLRAAFPPPVPERLPSPDLPPPSPPTVLEDEVFASDEPLPPPPPELNSLDKISTSESHGERTRSPQKHLSQNVSSVQRHQDTVTQRNLETVADSSPENASLFHNDSEAKRLVESIASSPHRPPENLTQRRPDNVPSPQSPPETSIPRISVACNAPSIRHVDDSTQNDCSATVQQKYHRNSSSPDSTHTLQRPVENGISSQRYPDPGVSLSRHIEDCVVPHKRVESIMTAQRHVEHNNVTQRHRENVTVQKHVINSNRVQGSVGSEITVQRYHQNGSFRRNLENGTAIQKQAESGNATLRQIDSVNLTQRSIGTVSISRSISSATLNRRQECGAVNNSHIASSSSHQGHVMLPAYRNMNDTFARTSAIKPLESDTCTSVGVPLSRHSEKIRSSLRYPTQKLMVNGKLAVPVSEQIKQQDGSLDTVRVADRNVLRNGEVQMPSKTHLQSALTEEGNGEGNVPEDPPRASRSPPCVQRENSLIERQQPLEGVDHEIKTSALPSAAVSAEGHTSDSQCINQTDQKNQEPGAPVTKLTTHSQP